MAFPKSTPFEKHHRGRTTPPPVRGFAAGGYANPMTQPTATQAPVGPDQNANGSWGAGTGEAIPAQTGNVSTTGTNTGSTTTGSSTSGSSTTSPTSTPGGGTYAMQGLPYDWNTGQFGFDDGGGVPDPGGAIPDDPDDSSDVDDTDTGDPGQAGDQGGSYTAPGQDQSQSDPNDTMSAVMDALSAARQQSGLTDQMFAANIPGKPAGPGGDQPDSNPFPTRFPAIPFGKRADSGASGGDYTQAAAKGGAIKALDDGGDPGADPNEGTEGTDAQVDSPDTGADTSGGALPPASDTGQQPSIAGPNATSTPMETQQAGAATGIEETPEGGMAGAQPSIMGYLQGGGALPQQMLKQAEKQVDPNGQLNPTERTMKTIAAMQTEDPAKGAAAIQGYRQQFDTLRAGAQTALVKGNDKVAAQNATLAFSNVPDGYNMAFLPAPGGGIIADVRQIGGASKQISLTREQFNGFLKAPGGPGSPFDNMMEQDGAKLLQQMTKVGGTPIQATRPATPGGRGPQAPQGPQAQNTQSGAVPTQSGAPAPVTAQQQPQNPAPSAPQYDPRAADPNADFGQGNQIVTRTPSPSAGVPAGASTPAGVRGGQAQPVTPGQNNAYSNWYKAQQQRNAALSTNQYAPGPNGTQKVQTVESAGTNNPQFANANKGAIDPFDQFDKKDVAAAQAQFGGNKREMLNWLYNQQSQGAERQNKVDVASEKGRNDILKAQQTGAARVQASQNYSGARVESERIKAAAQQQIANAKDPATAARWGVVRSLAAAGASPDVLNDRIKALGLTPQQPRPQQQQNQDQAGNPQQPVVKTLKDGKRVQQLPNGSWQVMTGQ